MTKGVARRAMRLSITTLLVSVAVSWILGVLGSQLAAREGDGDGRSASKKNRAYIVRGDQVEARYSSYRERLEQFFRTLRARLESDAPDLHAKLVQSEPAAVPYGYQRVPRIVPDLPRAAKGARVDAASFSWPRTESLVERGEAELGTLETTLADAVSADDAQRRAGYEKLVELYAPLVADQKRIASQIQYNRLWQAEIARVPAVYDNLTALYDAAVERQAWLEALPSGDVARAAELRARGEELAREISAAIGKFSPQPFVKIEQTSPRHWVVRVPLWTDIEDQAFVDAFRSAVERAWHVLDGEDEFSLALEIQRVPAGQLYPDGEVPARGTHIDLADHIGRFPAQSGVLTTGANTTHVLGCGIVVGPHDIAPNVLAHEFGHLLGFVDGYFRGYRDRGPDGYEVLEAVVDPEDIMSAPGIGHVMRRHFEQILEGRR